MNLRAEAFVAGFLAVLLYLPAGPAHAGTFTINTPGGSVEVDISHIGPGGSLVSAEAPTAPGFRPPTIFSAPLPSGSGARALGFAGAFTAIADDATAASWNPAGLIQLERSEASVVVRASQEIHDHESRSSSYRVGQDDFHNEELNYLSVVCPFQAGGLNWVYSANYQEAYDFTQRFTADMSEVSRETVRQRTDETFSDVVVDNYQQGATDPAFPNGIIDIEVTSYLSTHVQSALSQITSSDSLTWLQFEQEGAVEATTQAIAVELTPKVSVGAAVNFYRDNVIGGGRIRSRTTAKYSGASASAIGVDDDRSTAGTYTYEGDIHIPPGGGIPVWTDVHITGAGDYNPFSDSESSSQVPSSQFEGVYEEINEFDGLSGMNATFGVLWTVSRHLSLGAGIDLPWTAEGSQTKTVRNTITTYDASHTRALDVSQSESVQSESVEFEFPLYWAVGGVWRWNNRFYTAVDVSQTKWSKFSFRAGNDEKINPLDGSLFGESDVDDCWSCRAGGEYLWVLRSTEIPFRAGLSWEERPAIGAPDEYWGFSLGSGVSIGKDAGRVIIDVAYMFLWGDDVLGSLVPDQEGLSTDVMKHQLYVSSIWHF